MKKVILLSITLFTAVLLNAQIQNGINYQAAARDNAGNILSNQAVSFRLAILQGSSSGSTVYQETHALTTNSVGLVNLVIGTGTVNVGTYLSVNWANGPYFLQVEMAVGAGSFSLMGTSQFVSVPYALYAQHSGDKSKAGNGITIRNDSIHSSWSYSGNDIVANNNGNVGIGTTAINQKLEVNGGVGIGNTSTSSPGAIRFTGSDFEGYNGTGWNSFTKTSVDHFEYDNTTTYQIIVSTARNTMVLSPDSLIVPATGQYLILYTGKGNNPNSYDKATSSWDTEGRTGIINVSQSMNWVGGTYALFYGQYENATPASTYVQYIPQTFSTSMFASLNAGDVLKAGAVVLPNGVSPTTTWLMAPFKIQLIKLN